MPKINVKRMKVRGIKDRTWKGIPGFGEGVYPVVKTADMTQPVGRDEQGRLFTEPTGGGGHPDAVRYGVEQELTDAEQAQARANIGAGTLEIEITEEEVNLVTVTGTASVGQTIVVDAVDEDGHPVSWHAVDLPEGIKGDPGDAGVTPHIGTDGYWYIGETNTGVKAAGSDGVTPHIGENGNWFVGTVDTGVQAQGEPGDDYVLTDADKTEIAQQAAALVDTALLDAIGTGEVTA